MKRKRDPWSKLAKLSIKALVDNFGLAKARQAEAERHTQRIREELIRRHRGKVRVGRSVALQGELFDLKLVRNEQTFYDPELLRQKVSARILRRCEKVKRFYNVRAQARKGKVGEIKRRIGTQGRVS